MTYRFIPDLQNPFGGSFDASGDGLYLNWNFSPLAAHGAGNPFGIGCFSGSLGVPVPPEEAIESLAVGASAAPGATVVVTNGGMTFDLTFDAGAPAAFEAGIEQAASILSATIADKITVNLTIHYSGTGGGAFAGPTGGQYINYSTVRADLIGNATPGDATFNSLPSGASIQGQSQVAVWNAQLKALGLMSPTNAANDGTATFATDINPNLLVGVALHELTHALGRVPYGSPYDSQPDIFDLFRFTSPGTILIAGSNTAPATYFSVDGGNTALADYGLYSDPSDFLNPPNGALPAPYSSLTPNDPFNEIYTGSTVQALTSVDKEQLDALGFHLPSPPQLSVSNDANATRGQTVALSALVSISDPNHAGYQKLELWDSSGTVGGGQFLINGVAQTGGHEIDVTSANLANTVFKVGTLGGTDTLWAQLVQNNGALSGWQQFTVTAPAAQIPSLSVSNDLTATRGQHVALPTLVTILDPSNVGYSQLELWDSNGTPTGGQFVVNGVAQTGGHEIDVAPGNVAGTVFNVGTASGSDTLWAQLLEINGTVSGWQQFTVSTPADHGPVVTANSATITTGQSTVAAASLFTATDPDGDAVVSYDLWDTGTGGGHFIFNGAALAANQDNDLTAAQLAQTTYQAGAGGTDTLWVRASDGSVWGNWSSGFTVTGPVDHGPVVTASSVTLSAGHGTVAAGSLFTASDPDGDTVATYDLWDTGTGGGHFIFNGAALAANQDNFLTAAELAQTTYQAGSGAADTLWVRASDGSVWGNWSSGFTVTGPVDHGPVVTASSVTLSAGHGTVAAGSLFTASDPDGDTVATYDLWDTGAGGGHFIFNGAALAANQDNFLTAAELAQTTYQAGPGVADTLWVRASDGAVWGNWSSAFTVTGPVDHGPAVTASSVTLSTGHIGVAAASLFTASDPDGDAVTTYDVWDTGAGGGHFVFNGTALAANQDNYLTAGQLAQTAYQAGSGGTDTLWVRASDGVVWGNWSSAFTVTGPVDHAPVVTASSTSLGSGHNTVAAGSLFTASDPDGDAITTYDVWDTGAGGGQFVFNGAALAANQDNYLTAGQLAQTTYQAGAGGTDTLWVRASDGTLWGNWSNAFTVTGASGVVAGVTGGAASDNFVFNFNPAQQAAASAPEPVQPNPVADLINHAIGAAATGAHFESGVMTIEQVAAEHLLAGHDFHLV